MSKSKDTRIFEIFGRLFSQKLHENQQLLKLLTEPSTLLKTLTLKSLKHLEIQ